MSTVNRQRVVRADGRAITVVQRRAHLSYCFTGCCCGRTERGYAAVPAGRPLRGAALGADRVRLQLLRPGRAAEHPTGRPRVLADAIRGTYVRLTDLDEPSMLHVIRNIS